jgi:integrase
MALFVRSSPHHFGALRAGNLRAVSGPVRGLMSLTDDLASDLAAYVATLPSGTPVFPLPDEKGAKMLRPDLEAAGIPYQDASGLFFDFHSLRCETATLADAAGVSPRVVQKLMRHSTLELTGRYTGPAPWTLKPPPR